MAEPKGQRREMTDAELRERIERRDKPAQIAAEFGISRQAVYKRISQLEMTTVAAVVAPVESQQFVRNQIRAMDELTLILERVHLLLDATDRELRDPDNPRKYDVGPRAHEVTVVYLEEVGDDGKRIRKRDTLQNLLDQVGSIGEIDKTEVRCADPRELLLRTTTEVRLIVSTAAELAKMLVDARRVDTWFRVVQEVIARCSPEVASEIEGELRRNLALHAAFSGPECLPG